MCKGDFMINMDIYIIKISKIQDTSDPTDVRFVYISNEVFSLDIAAELDSNSTCGIIERQAIVRHHN